MNIKVLYHAAAVVLLVLNLSSSNIAFADEYAVSGNGDGSHNDASVSQDKSTTVEQNNQSEVENDVDAQAYTGDNEANGNSGGSKIETGDASSNVQIQNSGNVSSVSNECCVDEDSSAEISGNGLDSDNSINVNQSPKSTYKISNKLSLKNNILVNSNTGDNEADDNWGDVSITTGSINTNLKVLNKNLNLAKVKVSNDPSFNLLISGNGSGSDNSIVYNFDPQNTYSITNSLLLVNNVSTYANTGGNKANNNLGKVKISTGNIMLDILISNQANISEIIASCGCQTSVTPPLPPGGTPETPQPPPGGGCCSPTSGVSGSGGGGGSSGGSSSGSVLGESLPATGGISIYSLTFLALLMIILGVILRSDLDFKHEIKKVSRQFSSNFRNTVLGLYLLANPKDLYSFKARQLSFDY